MKRKSKIYMETERLLNPMCKPVKNSVVTNKTKGKHLDLMFQAAKQINELGLDYFCEAKLLNGKNPDLIIPAWGSAVEIMVSEKDENIIKKSKEYMGLKIIPIRSNADIFKELG